MGAWTGVVLALGEPGAHALRSRLSTYLHPLAGRPLAWHAVSCLAALRPPPAGIVVAAGPELTPELFQDIGPGIDVVATDERSLGSALAHAAAAGRVLVVDAAAPTAGPSLERLLGHDGDALLEGDDGRVLAAWLGEASALMLLSRGGDLGTLRASLSTPPEVMRDGDGFVVRTRADLARAGALVRDRVVRRLMDEGVSFLLPETVLIDVDVAIGRDSIVYPGCVIEGSTVIGEETVVGPCCRIVSTRVGSGVELKGFNYLSHTAIRNRAILEPYVRRGFDD